MEFTERITISDDTLNGKPAIKGKRIAVQTILEFLAAGETVETILYQYPTLQEEDIRACLQFTAELMKNNFVLKAVS